MNFFIPKTRVLGLSVGGDFVILACVVFTQCQPDRRTDTRGRLRAEPSLQLGTLSTRIANLLCIIHSALSRLSCRAYARRPCYTHGTHTRAWRPSAARGQRRDARQTRLTTNQPTNQPTNRTAAVLPVPSCKLGTSRRWLVQGLHSRAMLTPCRNEGRPAIYSTVMCVCVQLYG